VFEKLEDRKMLASITEDAGVVTVFGSSLDDVIVVASDDSIGTNISINAGQSGAIFAVFNNLLISEILVYGGNGNDAIYSSSPLTKKIFGHGGDDILRGSAGVDLIFGNDGNDRIIGNAGNDRLVGGNGDDIIIGGAGADTLEGGAGNDRLSGNSDSDSLVGGGGDDILYGGAGADVLLGGTEADRLFGQQGDDVLFGHGGDDFIYGGEGRDNLSGGPGVDWISGGENADTLSGGSGDDRLLGGDGNDDLTGGGGIDRIDGNFGDDVFTEDGLDIFADIGGGDRDRIRFGSVGETVFSHVYDNGYIDIYGTNLSEDIRIFSDQVTINGTSIPLDVTNAGFVRVFGLSGNDDIRVVGSARSSSAYELAGGDGDDILIAGAGDDSLNGGSGNDVVIGSDGDDRYVFAGAEDLGNDYISDRQGSNSVDFSFLELGVGVNFNLEGREYQNVARNAADGRKLNIRLDYGPTTTFQHVFGSAYDDYLEGSSGGYSGGRGDDTYRIGQFGVTIFESLDEGYDTLDFSGANFTAPIDLTDSWASSAEIERVLGSENKDIITGNQYTKEVVGGGGDDTYRFTPDFRYEDVFIIEDVGSGNDTFDFSQSDEPLNIDLRLAPDIENIIGTNFHDTIVGNANNNRLLGGSGNDHLQGLIGDDRLEGQEGIDIYVVNSNENDTVTDDSIGEVLFESGYDGDGDGLTAAEEVEIGTDPEKFDSDGDLLGDGFENGSDNLDPTQENDPFGDFDGDGLTELQEQIYSTDPDSSDSDGDGTSDFDEIEQGSDPNDSEDGGLEPRFEDVTELLLTVGDHSGSHSERYDLRVGPVLHQATVFGKVEDGTYTLERGKSHEVQIIHRGSNLDTPDYDYTAKIELPDLSQSLVILEDQEEILGVEDDSSDLFAVRGKTATVHLPQVDLDVINVDGSEVTDEKEDVFGGFLQPVPEDVNQSRELTELKIHKVDSPVAGHTQLIFNGSQVRIWKDRNRTEEVFTRNTEFDGAVDHSVFVESLFESNDHKVLFIRAKFEVDNVDVGSQFTVFPGEVQDRIKLITLSFDLDIDSNNNDGFNLPEDDKYSEELEDNEYGLGKLVFKSSNQQGDNDTEIVDQFTPVVIRLPAGIDPDENDLKVRFDFDPIASGIFWVWTKDKNENPIDQEVGQGGDRIFVEGEYSLADLNYDSATGEIVFYVDGKAVSLGATLAELENSVGRTNLFIKATLVIDDDGAATDVLTDEVKFLVVQDRHFFTALQQREEVRGELTARGVYGVNDVPSDLKDFSLKRLSKEELDDLELGNEAKQLLYNEQFLVTSGFKAALYQDYLAPEDETYIVAFAGTDPSAVDIIDDIRQGLGLSSPQYASAIRLADLLNDAEEITNLTFSGHSLGGGLASAAAVVTGFHALTYNAAGLSTDTLYRRNLAGKVLEINGQNIEIVPGSIARYQNAAGLIDAYYVDFDALSNFQDFAPGIVSALGTRHLMDGPYDRAMGAVAVASVTASFFSVGLGGAILANTAGASLMGLSHVGDAVLHGLLVDETNEIDLLGYFVGSDYPVFSGE